MLSLQTYAITLEQCSNQDADASEIVTDDYIFCINRNFVKLRNYLELSRISLPRCRNLDYSMIDMRFIDCINDNVQKLGAILKLKFGHCPNYSTEELQSVFISCINGKFERIDNFLNQ
jgi:hypothetical protein